MKKRPFFTLIVRACWRPRMLQKALCSALSQTDTDIEIIFIVDMKKKGVKWANAQYRANAHRINGQYVYTLDDDTFLVSNKLIASIRRIATKHNNPDVIMVKGSRPQLSPKILPKSSVWKHRERLKVASTNGACFIASSGCWRKYAGRYSANAAGDWRFLSALKSDGALRFYWFDFIAKETQQLGRGKKFEDCNTKWWVNTVKRFQIERNKDGWFLPLWKWNDDKLKSVRAKCK